MGMYLNQLPPTEVARLKAELAETLIAHFCYPRFYDYRTGGLRVRPVDRVKRQEVWQYLNAVDFNVWGRVDVDSPDFQRQVERLFIHFVQRNRSFFGEQGRKRMADVRALITHCSTALADGLRGHLRGQAASPPFGTPRPVSSWSGGRGANVPDLSWEQVLTGTMQLQQQLQEARGEVSTAVPPTPSVPPTPAARPAASVPSRRTRTSRPTSTGGSARSNGSGAREEEAAPWPGARKGPLVAGEIRYPSPSEEMGRAASVSGRDSSSASYASLSDASPTMPLPLGRPETPASAPASTETSSPPRTRRSRSAEVPAATQASSSSPLPRALSQPLTVSAAAIPAATQAPPSGPLPRALSQPLTVPAAAIPARPSQPDLGVKQAESATALTGDEDVVIFEQMRHQLVVWLRVEAVHSGVELGDQGAFQLVEALRRQDGVDTTRLQIVSTLLGVCDQVTNCGRATLFDYKQAMMFYLMHTRRSR